MQSAYGSEIVFQNKYEVSNMSEKSDPISYLWDFGIEGKLLLFLLPILFGVFVIILSHR
jgi:hypothetical protein